MFKNVDKYGTQDSQNQTGHTYSRKAEGSV